VRFSGVKRGKITKAKRGLREFPKKRHPEKGYNWGENNKNNGYRGACNPPLHPAWRDCLYDKKKAGRAFIRGREKKRGQKTVAPTGFQKKGIKQAREEGKNGLSRSQNRDGGLHEEEINHGQLRWRHSFEEISPYDNKVVREKQLLKHTH